MGALTQSQIAAEVAAGRTVLLRNGNSFTIIDTTAEVPADDPTIAAGLTDLSAASSNFVDHLTIAEAKNIIVGTTTGTKIGTSTSQKLGFFNKTPVVQPVGANQAALTDSTGGTAAFSLVDVTGSHSQSILNANFASLARLVNQLRSDLVTLGLIKGAA